MRWLLPEVFIQLTEFLSEILNENNEDAWENERTPTQVQRSVVRLYTLGLYMWETVAIL